MSASHPQADDSAGRRRLAGSMNSENPSPASGTIDPAAIALIGTYAIDLTATTHSNIAEPG